MSTFDTIVIGAGMSGLTSARMLADAGQSVVVLERTRPHRRSDAHRPRRRIPGRPRRVVDPWDRGLASWNLVHALRIPAIEYTVGSFQVGGRPIENFDGDGHPMDEAATAQWIADVDMADRLLVEEIAASSPGDTYLDVTERALDRSGFAPERIDDIREFCRHRVEEQCGAWIGDLDAHGLDEDAIEGDEVISPAGTTSCPDASAPASTCAWRRS